jgi:hypothetical protein
LVWFALLLLVVSTAALAQSQPFADVPSSHWAYAAVNRLAETGIIEGYPDGYFKGDKMLTRYEFAIAIARALDWAQVQFQPIPGPAGPAGPEGAAGPAGPAGGGPGLTEEQKALLERLQKEFLPELKALRSDLDSLTRRVEDIEAQLGTAPAPSQPKVTVGGSIEYNTGLYGTSLETERTQSTGYPYYPFLFDTYDLGWYSGPQPWGAINIPLFGGQPWFSIPVSDALKDAFKASDFNSQRTEVDINANLGPNLTAKVGLLADPRGNLVSPDYASMYGINEATEWLREILDGRLADSVAPAGVIAADGFPFFGSPFGSEVGFRSPNAFSSNGLMDTVRVNEAWIKFNGRLWRPLDLTVGQQYFGFGSGLLANNSMFPIKAVRGDMHLTKNWTATGIYGHLDREAFYGQSSGDVILPGSPGNFPPEPISGLPLALPDTPGQDTYLLWNTEYALSPRWTVGGTLLQTGFRFESGWDAYVHGQIGPVPVWGEYARLTELPRGNSTALNGTDVSEDNTAWLVGAGLLNSDSIKLNAQYGQIGGLYAFSLGGFDPVGALSFFSTTDIAPLFGGYLNLPLSLLHPEAEFNPHYINWADRPLFLDPTNIVKGWEVSLTFPKLIAPKTPLSIRYYDGDAFTGEYLASLIDGTTGVSKFRQGDRVWTVSLSRAFADNLVGTLLYGRRQVSNVMSPNDIEVQRLLGIPDVQQDDIQVLRASLSLMF